MTIKHEIEWNIFQDTYWVTTSLRENSETQKVKLGIRAFVKAPEEIAHLKYNIIRACTENIEAIFAHPASPVFTSTGVAKPEVPRDSTI